jgi:hypothetical protein
MQAQPTLKLLRGEQGIALPLALIGLVVVSLLVTTAVLTSSAELALSRAQREASISLFETDAALDSYVAWAAGAMAAGTPLDDLVGTASFRPADLVQGAAGGENFDVSVSRLYRIRTQDGATQLWHERGVYSIVARPGNGRGWGRRVGVMVDAVREWDPVDLQIHAGLSVGSNLTISGNAKISDGRDNATCSEGPAEHALEYGSDNTLDRHGVAHDIEGDAHQSHLTGAELMQRIFGQYTLDDLAAGAEKKFGPRFNQPDFTGGADGSKPKWDHTNQRLRWGCPAGVGAGCASVAGADTAYYPVIAIDAKGGEVSITGDHGQGTLIVVNGNLRIGGNFKFKGLVLVENSLTIVGTPSIHGGVVALGASHTITPEESSMGAGTAVISFDACAAARAQEQLSQSVASSVAQAFTRRPFAWFETFQ